MAARRRDRTSHYCRSVSTSPGDAGSGATPPRGGSRPRAQRPSLARLDIEAETRRAFASVLAGERRVSVLRDAAERLAKVAAAVTRRLDERRRRRVRPPPDRARAS